MDFVFKPSKPPHSKAGRDRDRCYYCNEKPVVYLRYADRHLCKRHFNRLVEKRFSRALREQGLKAKETVVIGVSGGKDSLAMLYMFKKLLAKIPLKLIALSIDEGIADYRDESLKRAEDYAKALGIEYHRYSFREEIGKSLDEIMEGKEEEPACGYCGVFRRQLLNDKAKELGADWVAIGHNLDDAVQTIMMNLLRNEPSRIARYFKPLYKGDAFVPRLKPNIWIPERELSIYALLNDIPFENSECPYAKYSIRYFVRHLINRLEDRYPGAKFRIMRSMQSMIDKMQFEDVEEKLKRCKVCGRPSNTDICMFCRLLAEVKGLDNELADGSPSDDE